MSNFDYETPSTEQTIAQNIEEAVKDLRVAMPVKVISFNASKQTVSVQPMIKITLSAGGSMPLPVLVDVPVKFPRGGGFAVTFPIIAGDEGLVIISDRCIDGWYQSGSLSDPLDLRLHDLSDASFLPGVSSLPNVITAFDSDALVMRKLDNSAYLKIDQAGAVTVDGTMCTIKCPLIFEKGMQGANSAGGEAMTVTGSLKHTGGDLSSNGVVLGLHKHTGVTAGGDNTGEPI